MNYSFFLIGYHPIFMGPGREQLLDIVDDFKATFCPSLTSNHFNSLFVLHQDKGNTEIHFVIPTQELTSGRRMNIHPPGKANLEFFEAYTRVTNHRMHAHACMGSGLA